MALTAGRVRTEAFTPELLKDKGLRDLIDKVEVTVDPEIESGFPKHRAARIEIETTGGERFEHYAPTRKGDPDNPLTDAELAEKFLELTGPVLGEAEAEALLDALWGLDKATELTALPAWVPEATAAQ